jgi:hypothetical protein
VVEAGAAVEQDDRRTLPHRHPVGDEFRPIHIDEQPNVANRDEHGATLTGDPLLGTQSAPSVRRS